MDTTKTTPQQNRQSLAGAMAELESAVNNGDVSKLISLLPRPNNKTTNGQKTEEAKADKLYAQDSALKKEIEEKRNAIKVIKRETSERFVILRTKLNERIEEEQTKTDNEVRLREIELEDISKRSRNISKDLEDSKKRVSKKMKRSMASHYASLMKKMALLLETDPDGETHVSKKPKKEEPKLDPYPRDDEEFDMASFQNNQFSSNSDMFSKKQIADVRGSVENLDQGNVKALVRTMILDAEMAPKEDVPVNRGGYSTVAQKKPRKVLTDLHASAENGEITKDSLERGILENSLRGKKPIVSSSPQRINGYESDSSTYSSDEETSVSSYVQTSEEEEEGFFKMSDFDNRFLGESQLSTGKIEPKKNPAKQKKRVYAETPVLNSMMKSQLLGRKKKPNKDSKPKLTKGEDALCKKDKENYGGWKELPEYIKSTVLGGLNCEWCFEVIASGKCMCLCNLGHRRYTCCEKKDGSPVAHGMRHDGGFFPTHDISKVYENLRSSKKGSTDILIKKQQWAELRSLLRERFPSMKLDTMIPAIMKNCKTGKLPKEKAVPCPICLCTNSLGNKALTICGDCRQGGVIRKNWNAWRELAGMPVKKKSGLTKTPENGKRKRELDN